MSRETQYIGLTKAAEDFLEGLDELVPDTKYKWMGDEFVMLGKWAMHPLLQIEGRDMCIREVVQDVPWSSGPMIFTCLEFDYGNGSKSMAFEWVHDPTIGREFNPETIGHEYHYERGAMWV